MRPGHALVWLWAVGCGLWGGHLEPTAHSLQPTKDAQMAHFAQELLKSQDPKVLRQGAARLRNHAFRGSKAPEREIVLYAQGEALRRLGDLTEAYVAFHKLEKSFPRSKYLGEAQLPMGEEALNQERFKEAEIRLKAALESDLPGERKREAQELLLWTFVQSDRAADGKFLLDTLRPLEEGRTPSEKGLAAVALVQAASDLPEPMDQTRMKLREIHPRSHLLPKVELAYARLLARKGQLPEAANAFRKMILEFPKTPEGDEARLALATLLTEGKLSGKAVKTLPDAESLMAELRKRGTPADVTLAEVVELRLAYKKELWEEVLDKGAAWMEKHPDHVTAPEVGRLWKDAWNLWTKSRLEKGYSGLLLQRLKPTAYASLEPEQRKGVAGLLANQGLAHTVPGLLAELPPKDRPALAREALSKLQPEAQPEGALALLPPPGKGSAQEELARLQASVALKKWDMAKAAAGRAQAGPERIRGLVALLQRPMGAQEKAGQRRAEGEGWLPRLKEKPAEKEPLLILLADLRLQTGDPRGALALYPEKPEPPQLGWVSLMRAQALAALGRKAEAKAVLKAAEGADGFRQQRETLAKGL